MNHDNVTYRSLRLLFVALLIVVAANPVEARPLTSQETSVPGEQVATR